MIGLTVKDYFDLKLAKGELDNAMLLRIAELTGKLESVIHEVQKYQPQGSPPPGDEITLIRWIMQTQAKCIEVLEETMKKTSPTDVTQILERDSEKAESADEAIQAVIEEFYKAGYNPLRAVLHIFTGKNGKKYALIGKCLEYEVLERELKGAQPMEREG